MKIGVVIPVLNNFKGMAECLASLKTRHQWQPYIVPNWERGLSVAASWNEYAARAFTDGADLVLITGDDVIFSEHTVDALTELILREDDEKIVLVTGVSVSEKSIDGSDTSMVKKSDITVWSKPKEELLDESPDFSCFMITPRTFKLIGMFDENFHPAYYEDNDFHHRINLLGYRAISTTQAPFYHERSTTLKTLFDGLPEEYKTASKQVNAQNKNYYVKKWGGLPGEEIFDNPYNDDTLNALEWNAGLN